MAFKGRVVKKGKGAGQNQETSGNANAAVSKEKPGNMTADKPTSNHKRKQSQQHETGSHPTGKKHKPNVVQPSGNKDSEPAQKQDSQKPTIKQKPWANNETQKPEQHVTDSKVISKPDTQHTGNSDTAEELKVKAKGNLKAKADTGKAGQTAAAVGSNWAALRLAIGATGEGAKKRQQAEAQKGRKPSTLGSNTGVTPIVALDCEMVGVGPDGTRSALARVAVINAEGNVLLDVFVKPKEKVTDYRTQHSGVRPADLKSPDAVELEEAQRRVAALIKGRVLVGHALSNDLSVLLLDHPRKDIRDTARYHPLMRSPAPGRKPKPRALRQLAAEHLGLDIQTGEHSPVDDARAALYLYLQHKKEWEAAIKNGTINRSTKAIKEVRKSAVSAAALAAVTGTGSSTMMDGSQVDAKTVLSGAQLRALRTGRALRKMVVKGSGNVSNHQVDGNPYKAAGSSRSMQLQEAEIAELVAEAAKEGAKTLGVVGNKRARDMMQMVARDARLDPMADL